MENIQEDVRIYGFNTEDKNYASASQIIYSIYRSRDTEKFSAKASKSYWGAVEAFCKKSARGSTTVIRFIERFKKEMEAKTIQTMFLNTDLMPFKVAVIDHNGKVVIPNKSKLHTYLTNIIKSLDDRKILDILLEETAYIIMLVRERIETEKELGNDNFKVVDLTNKEDFQDGFNGI